MKLTTSGKLRVHGLLIIAVVCLGLTGCDEARNYLKPDRTGNMEMQDYKDAMAERLPEIEESAAAAGDIPSLQPYIASPDANAEVMPLVSISVNQTVPLRDMLFELAKQADYDIELDPRITGAVIFTARERPFDEVIERVSDIANLRYKFEGNTLRVEVDMPYNKLYKIDYLSYIRKNSSSVRNDIAVVTGDGADTGSAFEATAESESNFWGELEVSLQQILGGAAGSGLKTSSDPRITAVEQNPDVQAVAAPDAEGNVQVQPPEAVLRVESLPVDDASGGGVETPAAAATFSINKQAGLINVFANEKAHKEIEAYLKVLKRAVTSQVLIEAKILEVTLTDEFETGIDWRAVDLGGLTTLNFLSTGGAATLNSLGTSSNAAATGSSAFNVGYSSNDFEAFISAVSRFGTVKALASPRLTVLNNQSAILNVATNQVFFEIDVDVSTNEGETQTDIDSDIRNVPEGVLVNVQPSINLEDKTISMAVRPTVTRIVNEVSDPAIDFIAAAAVEPGDPPLEIESLIPELNVQEIDSVIQVHSGQAIVMGGLLQDRLINSEDSVPVLGEAPVFGALFRQHDDVVQKTELVIFLKATILESPSDSVHSTDKDFYRRFSGDRRPLKL